MKRSQLAFTALLIPVDYIMLIMAAITAYSIRVSNIVTSTFPVDYILNYQTYLKTALLVSPAWMVVFALAGLYNIKSNRKLSSELGKIFIATSLSLLVMVFAIFLQRELFSSRFIIMMAWIISILYVFFGRVLVLAVQRHFFKKGLGAIKIIAIGQGGSAAMIITEITKNPSHGFRVIKNYDNFDSTVKDKILELHQKHILDEIVVVNPNIDKGTMLDIIDFTEENHLGFRYAADLFNTVARNASIEPIAGVPIIELKKTRLDGWGRVFKRVFDIFASLILIIILSPVLIITAFLVKITSNGPFIFKNERVGQKGEVFETYKFRSMKSEFSIGKQFSDSKKALAFEQELISRQNSRSGPIYKIMNDPRLTPIGTFIRKWSIDELPQLFNVFNGTMSLVGPRPHQPREVEHYDRHQKRLLTIKPGITGMAQVSGRSDLPFDDEAKLDIYYIEHWSPWLDIKILLKTPRAIFSSRKVE